MIKASTMTGGASTGFDFKKFVPYGLILLLVVLVGWGVNNYFQAQRITQQEAIQLAKTGIGSLTISANCDLNNLKNYARFILYRDAFGDSTNYGSFNRNQMLACFPVEGQAADFGAHLTKLVKNMKDAGSRWTEQLIDTVLAQLFP